MTTSADNTFNDSRCSLREAIRSANLDRGIGGCVAGSGNDTILVPPGTFRLTLTGRDENHGLEGDLDIRTNMTIRGSTGVPTIVEGFQADRVIQIHEGVHVTIDHVMIMNGTTSPRESTDPRNAGGGISNYANLTLTNSLVTDNSTGSYGQGGGIFNSGMITIKDSWITYNGAEAGGGIFSSGSAYVIRTHVENNSAYGRMSTAPYVYDPGSSNPQFIAGDAGGITSTGYLSVSRSVVAENSGHDEWGHGGIAMTSGVVTDSTIRDNTAAGCGTGGVAMISSQIIGSTVTGNGNGDCGGAGGVYSVYGNIRNSTISGNSSLGDVGGIRVEGGWIIASTITLNHSGGGGNGFATAGGVEANGAAAIRGSIVAGNTGSTGWPNFAPVPDCAGTLESRGHNLIGDISGCGLVTRATDLVNVDPRLGPLADNGGPTMTHTLRPGSRAIDAWVDIVDVYQPPCERYDQRGVHRPQDGDHDGVAKCDIGALEWMR